MLFSGPSLLYFEVETGSTSPGTKIADFATDTTQSYSITAESIFSKSYFVLAV